VQPILALPVLDNTHGQTPAATRFRPAAIKPPPPAAGIRQPAVANRRANLRHEIVTFL